MAAAIPVLAAPAIDGELQFVGSVTLNGPLDTATAFTSFLGPLGTGSPVVMSGATGAYANVPAGTQATFSLFTFKPSPAAVPSLWSFAVGTTAFSFDATSVSIALQDASFLQVEGAGVAHITGYADTTGSWSFTDTGSGPAFTFGALSVVPEPSTAGLLLVGLLAWGKVRRNRR